MALEQNSYIYEQTEGRLLDDYEPAPYFPQAYPVGDEVSSKLHASLGEQAEALSIADHSVLAEGKNRPLWLRAGFS